jgi:DNA-binding transcriptional MerR regulator/effector-binding domain-containing protein
MLPRMGDEAHRRLFTIGEFSKISGLTIKSLRFYHEQGLLAPAVVDSQTGYRYYDTRQVETARVIAYLRGVEFPVSQIKELLQHVSDDQQLLGALQQHKTALEQRIRQQRKAVHSLARFIREERQAQIMAQTDYAVNEKLIESVLIGGVRMKGRYSDCGKGFARIGRTLGRHICGNAFLLHYDDEYKEDDADFEACMPLGRSKVTPDVSIRELQGGRCVSLLHKGPYEQLGHSYARILKYVKDRGYRIVMPTREVYLKGPGMIFKGNPSNYLTEIQMLFEERQQG